MVDGGGGGGDDIGGVLLLNRAGRDSSFPPLNVEQMECDETVFALRDSECEIGFRIKLRELNWPLCRNWEMRIGEWWTRAYSLGSKKIMAMLFPKFFIISNLKVNLSLTKEVIFNPS